MKRGWMFELQLAMRFLLENKRQTLLILMGIAVGVMVMVFLTALIDGLQRDLIQKTVGNSPHIQVSREVLDPLQEILSADGDALLPIQIQRQGTRPIVEWLALTADMAADPEMTAVVPVLDGAALLRRGGSSQSVALRGMKLEEADKIYDISNRIIAGRAELAPGTLLVGSELAVELNLKPGDTLSMEIPGKEPVSVLVGGIFDLGVQNLNKRWVIMERSRTAYLLGYQDKVSLIELQVRDPFKAEEIAANWASRLPGYKVENWQVSNSTLLTALKSQSNSSYTIQAFVLLAVTLGIGSVLAISAVQKNKEIGILKAIGLSTGGVVRIFTLQGCVLGITGSLLGLFMGVGLAQLFILFGSGGNALTLLLKPFTLAIILMVTIGASVIAAYIPARRVSTMNPIEVIRNG